MRNNVFQSVFGIEKDKETVPNLDLRADKIVSTTSNSRTYKNTLRNLKWENLPGLDQMHPKFLQETATEKTNVTPLYNKFPKTQ